jgi:hypothetical protein
MVMSRKPQVLFVIVFTNLRQERIFKRLRDLHSNGVSEKSSTDPASSRIIVAGGGSLRMGRDKANTELHGTNAPGTWDPAGFDGGFSGSHRRTCKVPKMANEDLKTSFQCIPRNLPGAGDGDGVCFSVTGN